MTRKRRAIVIGGSMSGLLAAIMLRRRGWDVEIFERVEKELADRGAGIVAQAELIARMNALGLQTRDLGVLMSTRKILDQSGAVTTTLECPRCSPHGSGCIAFCAMHFRLSDIIAVGV